MTDATLFQVDGGVATITLNRPDRRNALSLELVESLHANLVAALADPSVRPVVASIVAATVAPAFALSRTGSLSPKPSWAMEAARSTTSSSESPVESMTVAPAAIVSGATLRDESLWSRHERSSSTSSKLRPGCSA